MPNLKMIRFLTTIILLTFGLTSLGQITRRMLGNRFYLMKSLRHQHLLIVFLLLCVSHSTVAQIRTLKGDNLTAIDVDRFIKSQMDSLEIPAMSIAIVEDGRMVYYQASGVKNNEKQTIDTNTLFEAASMTKPVFAYAVHKLIKKEVLDLDTPLYKYYPYEDIQYDNRHKLITARMVLSHTTGLPNWRDGSKLAFIAAPGDKYGYSGEGYEYLGKVVGHLTGKKLEDIIEEEVFNLFEIKNSYMIKNKYVEEHLADGLKDNQYWGKNRLWLQPGVAFSLCTESKEYAKFLIALIRESGSSGSIFQAMSLPQLEVDPQKSIGLGVFIEKTSYGLKYSHSGNNNNRYNSNFAFYKDSKIGFVFFMNCHKELAFTKRLNDFLINGK